MLNSAFVLPAAADGSELLAQLAELDGLSPSGKSLTSLRVTEHSRPRHVIATLLVEPKELLSPGPHSGDVIDAADAIASVLEATGIRAEGEHGSHSEPLSVLLPRGPLFRRDVERWRFGKRFCVRWAVDQYPNWWDSVYGWAQPTKAFPPHPLHMTPRAQGGKGRLMAIRMRAWRPVGAAEGAQTDDKEASAGGSSSITALVGSSTAAAKALARLDASSGAEREQSMVRAARRAAAERARRGKGGGSDAPSEAQAALAAILAGEGGRKAHWLARMPLAEALCAAVRCFGADPRAAQSLGNEPEPYGADAGGPAAANDPAGARPGAGRSNVASASGSRCSSADTAGGRGAEARVALWASSLRADREGEALEAAAAAELASRREAAALAEAEDGEAAAAAEAAGERAAGTGTTLARLSTAADVAGSLVGPTSAAAELADASEEASAAAAIEALLGHGSTWRRRPSLRDAEGLEAAAAHACGVGSDPVLQGREVMWTVAASATFALVSGWGPHAPGAPAEAMAVLRRAVDGDERNRGYGEEAVSLLDAVKALRPAGGDAAAEGAPRLPLPPPEEVAPAQQRALPVRSRPLFRVPTGGRTPLHAACEAADVAAVRGIITALWPAALPRAAVPGEVLPQAFGLPDGEWTAPQLLRPATDAEPEGARGRSHLACALRLAAAIASRDERVETPLHAALQAGVTAVRRLGGSPSLAAPALRVVSAIAGTLLEAAARAEALIAVAQAELEAGHPAVKAEVTASGVLSSMVALRPVGSDGFVDQRIAPRVVLRTMGSCLLLLHSQNARLETPVDVALH
ncbi:hypothetical protein FNF27_03516 [Cafeteria roenbergensis]|uniref:Uncharacterized protein n=1 Tax=Cafeteria roenbergensis TaxID=33653 RepID=A0A5A8ECS2_CAFRO|nr:hypothetical protein FNF27_03516 [Cafeteria roenbergensis]